MDFWRSYDQNVEHLVILLVLIIVLTFYNATTRGNYLSEAGCLRVRLLAGLVLN